MRRLAAVAFSCSCLLFALAACGGGPAPVPDGGGRDAGAGDSDGSAGADAMSPADAGRADAGRADAGRAEDGGPDAGRTDAGGPDGGGKVGADGGIADGGETRDASTGAEGGISADPCPEEDLGSTVGDAVASGSTVGAADDVDAACAGGGGPDRLYAWTAPSAGSWIIDLAGSDYDTALQILDGCGGTALACDDDGGPGVTSRVQVDLTAGQAIVISVEGFSGETGNFVLNIHPAAPELCTGDVDEDRDGFADCEDTDCSADPVCIEICDNGADDDADRLIDCEDSDCSADPACAEICSNGADDDADGLIDCEDSDCSADPACAEPCPEADLGSAVGPAVFMGSTVGYADNIPGTCGGGGGPDRVFAWTAPESGTYTFDLVGSTYDTVLQILESCDGMVLACNDDSVGSTSSITIDLAVGQSIVIVVEGYRGDTGDFVLNISR